MKLGFIGTSERELMKATLPVDTAPIYRRLYSSAEPIMRSFTAELKPEGIVVQFIPVA